MICSSEQPQQDAMSMHMSPVRSLPSLQNIAAGSFALAAVRITCSHACVTHFRLQADPSSRRINWMTIIEQYRPIQSQTRLIMHPHVALSISQSHWSKTCTENEQRARTGRVADPHSTCKLWPERVEDGDVHAQKALAIGLPASRKDTSRSQRVLSRRISLGKSYPLSAIT